MSPRSPRLALVLAAALAALAPAAGAQEKRVAMAVHVPRDAAIASLTAHAGEARDLCGPDEELRRDARGWICSARRSGSAAPAGETYQTFELGHAGAGARLAAACLGPEDRVLSGTCVRRAAGGYVSFAGRAISADGNEAVECALDGSEPSSAVGIAICLDVPPLR